MKTNKNEVFLTISAIIALIIGIVASITIIGLIVGVPLLIASKKFFAWAKLTDAELLEERQSIIVWSVVLSILTFPLGLISLVAVFNLEGQLENLVTPKEKTDPTIEKLNKLQKLKDEGTINEEEFKLAKQKILNEL